MIQTARPATQILRTRAPPTKREIRATLSTLQDPPCHLLHTTCHIRRSLSNPCVRFHPPPASARPLHTLPSTPFSLHTLPSAHPPPLRHDERDGAAESVLCCLRSSELFNATRGTHSTRRKGRNPNRAREFSSTGRGADPQASPGCRRPHQARSHAGASKLGRGST